MRKRRRQEEGGGREREIGRERERGIAGGERKRGRGTRRMEEEGKEGKWKIITKQKNRKTQKGGGRTGRGGGRADHRTSGHGFQR